MDWVEAPKHFRNQNLYQKKIMVTGGLLLIWSTTAFWIPAKLLCLRSMLSKSMRYTEISRLAPGIGPQKGSKSSPWQCPTAHHTTNTSKVELIELRSFASSIPDFPSTDYYFFKHLENFLQGKYFQNQQEAENAFQEFVESWNMDFYTTGINQLILHWQKCVDRIMVPILINKDVLEPSYND